MEINKFIRKNIAELVPYSSARDDFKGEAAIFLDANENPYNSNFNRYPDPSHKILRNEASKLFSVSSNNIFIGNGSDEAIDLILRITCVPSVDNVIICPPTYGMYEVAANVNDVKVIKVPQSKNFEIDTNAVIAKANKNTKVAFICSPNNPTANLVSIEIIETLLQELSCFVIVDEAYIDFAKGGSALSLLSKYNNLIILRTMSKAWGMAGIRVGFAIADKELINILYNVKLPYNVNIFSQNKALNVIKNINKFNKQRINIINQKEHLQMELSKLDIIKKIYPSDANFVLVKTTDSKRIYEYLKQKQIIVRDRSSNLNCENCLRITVGTKKENKQLVKALKIFK